MRGITPCPPLFLSLTAVGLRGGGETSPASGRTLEDIDINTGVRFSPGARIFVLAIGESIMLSGWQSSDRAI